jgi:Asp-tRNA(Asn)/Glu-tRNA(Gln) amidotransferase B subunit
MKEYGHHYDFNIRVLYYEEPTPKLKEGMTSDVILWNVITLYYHEYFEELEEIKKTPSSSFGLMTTFLINSINFVTNEMASFCNNHKVPDPRPHKKGEMITLPIDEYPIWFNNLEDFISDITWGNKDRRIMMNEVLPKLLNSFEAYKDVIETIDFSTKDESDVSKIIDEVLEKMPAKVADYKSGKIGLINMFFGEVMKAAGGKINAKEARKMLEEKLV